MLFTQRHSINFIRGPECLMFSGEHRLRAFPPSRVALSTERLDLRACGADEVARAAPRRIAQISAFADGGLVVADTGHQRLRKIDVSGVGKGLYSTMQ